MNVQQILVNDWKYSIMNFSFLHVQNAIQYWYIFYLLEDAGLHMVN